MLSILFSILYSFSAMASDSFKGKNICNTVFEQSRRSSDSIDKKLQKQTFSAGQEAFRSLVKDTYDKFQIYREEALKHMIETLNETNIRKHRGYINDLAFIEQILQVDSRIDSKNIPILFTKDFADNATITLKFLNNYLSKDSIVVKDPTQLVDSMLENMSIFVKKQQGSKEQIEELREDAKRKFFTPVFN